MVFMFGFLILLGIGRTKDPFGVVVLASNLILGSFDFIFCSSIAVSPSFRWLRY